MKQTTTGLPSEDIDITVPSTKPVPRKYEESETYSGGVITDAVKPHPASYTTSTKPVAKASEEQSSNWIAVAILLAGLAILGYVGFDAFTNTQNPPTSTVTQPTQEAPVVIPPTQDSPKEEAPVGPVKQVDEQPVKVVPMTKEEITNTLKGELKQTN